MGPPIARSRREAVSRVERARMLMRYRDDPSFFAIGRALGVHHQTVQRCVDRALRHGVAAVLDDSPRSGPTPQITGEALAWLVNLACCKAKDLGYPHELWTTQLLARHAREHGPVSGHACFARLAQGTVCELLDRHAVKPHKVCYYLERRDPEFKQKMDELLCVYREVALLKQAGGARLQESGEAVAIIVLRRKAGVQASGAVGRLAWGWAADRIGDGLTVLVILGVWVTVGTLATAALAPDWPVPAVQIVAALFGFAAMGWNGVFLAEVARLSKPGTVGVTTGAFVAVFSVGAVTGPALFAFVTEQIGSYTTGFALLSVIACATALAAVIARRSARAEASDEPSRGA